MNFRLYKGYKLPGITPIKVYDLLLREVKTGSIYYSIQLGPPIKIKNSYQLAQVFESTKKWDRRNKDLYYFDRGFSSLDSFQKWLQENYFEYFL